MKDEASVKNEAFLCLTDMQPVAGQTRDAAKNGHNRGMWPQL